MRSYKMKIKPINWRGHRWNEVLPENNQSMREAGYDIILRRDPSISELRRYGQCVAGIDAKSIEIATKYPRILEAVKNL